jgi:hypothetical protein
LHAIRGAEQLAAHVPRLQSGAVPPHFVPHAPQFVGSLAMVAHLPPQSRVDVGHVQVPSAQA